MSTRLIPLHDYIVVERTRAEKKTDGGIVLPASTQVNNNEGTVLAVGPGRINDNGELIPLVGISVCDFVMFDNWADIDVDGKKLALVRASNVVARKVVE